VHTLFIDIIKFKSCLTQNTLPLNISVDCLWLENNPAENTICTLFEQSSVISNAKTDDVIVATKRENDTKLCAHIIAPDATPHLPF
jgi:hypothetical protein